MATWFNLDNGTLHQQLAGARPAAANFTLTGMHPLVANAPSLERPLVTVAQQGNQAVTLFILLSETGANERVCRNRLLMGGRKMGTYTKTLLVGAAATLAFLAVYGWDAQFPNGMTRLRHYRTSQTQSERAMFQFRILPIVNYIALYCNNNPYYQLSVAEILEVDMVQWRHTMIRKAQSWGIWSNAGLLWLKNHNEPFHNDMCKGVMLEHVMFLDRFIRGITDNNTGFNRGKQFTNRWTEQVNTNWVQNAAHRMYTTP